METKRFIGNDMARIFTRVRRELGADAVIVQTRSLLRDGADPLIEVLAAPSGGGDDALTLALQRVMVESTLGRVEEPSASTRMTVGDLEDIAAREDADVRAFDALDRALGSLPAQEASPEWLEGFVSTSGGALAEDQQAIRALFDDFESEDALPPFQAPSVVPPPPVQWSPRPRIVGRPRPAEPSPEREPEAPAATLPRPFAPMETGVAAALTAAGFTNRAARYLSRQSPAGATAPQALERALADAHVAYPAEGRTSIITIQGAEGSGRTTALMRMALDCADSGREAVLVAADSSHAGGRAQVHAYGEALGLPVLDAFGPQDIVHAITRAAKGACVFIDVPAGRWNPPPMPGVEHFVYLAVPAHWQPAATESAIAEFDAAACAGAVITGVDLATGLTPALSLVVEAQLGIAFLSSGRDIATGIGIADPFTLASGVFTTPTRETTDGRLAVTA
ncbi:MAG: hypothetical protein U0837_00845 [Dehalococcoidia bacterium]